MKDPYLKPVIFGGLFISLLSVVFAPGIFLWALIGGYLTIRVANKITKEALSLIDILLLGTFSGTIGGTCLDVITTLSFKTPENRHSLILTLEKNWPKNIAVPDFNEMLPSIFLTTCVFIIIISIVFAVIGAFIGRYISEKKAINNN